MNAADGPEPGSIYLTVTGTSAEAGDDGEVGRGNRANGLITPHRPMSLGTVDLSTLAREVIDHWLERSNRNGGHRPVLTASADPSPDQRVH